MASLRTDIHNSFRRIAASPGQVLIIILILGLAIGANTAIFSLINVVLLQPPPYLESNRLVMVWGTKPGKERAPLSVPNFVDYQQQNRVFESMASFSGADFILTGKSVPERIHGAYVSDTFFEVLGVQPIIGRAFLGGESENKRPNDVVVISYGRWQRQFGSDPDVLGQKIVLNSQPYTLIGVLPPAFDFALPGKFRSADLWLPATLLRDNSARDDNYLRAIGRLKPGIALTQAQQDMSAISIQLAQNFPDANAGRDVKLVPLQEELVGDRRKPLLLLLGAVGFVLLIACSNAANLQLERVAMRQKEIAVRVALGASHARIVREMLTESLLVATLAGVVGVGIAGLGIKVLSSFFSQAIPRAAAGLMNFNVLFFTFILAVATGIFFGLIPLIQRSSTLLKPITENVRATSITPARRRFRDLLVVVEFTLSLVLLIGAGLLIRSFIKVLRVPLGFETGNVLVSLVDLPKGTYSDTGKQLSFYEKAIDQVRHLPSVKAAGLIDDLPLTSDKDAAGFLMEGSTAIRNKDLPSVQVRVLGFDYFKAMKIPLIEGRTFQDSDTNTSLPVMVVNRTLVRALFHGNSPVGKQGKLGIDSSVPWRTIIGVVGDVRDVGLENDPVSEVYLAFKQSPGPQMNVVISSQANPTSLTAAAREELHNVDTSLPYFPVNSLDALFANALSGRLFSMLIVSVFAAIAVILAVVGIYSVIAYSVVQRTHEIGVRMAMGAEKKNILGMIIKEGGLLCLGGLSLGVPIIAVVSRSISSLLFGVNALDPIVLLLGPVVLSITAVAACLIPAWRATKVEPIEALR